jgi:exopolysaccharide biosynthesis operon protein EpsL
MLSSLRTCLRPVGILIGTLFSLPAVAGPSDALHVYAGLGYAHDDNLLRVPDGVPAFDNTRGDSSVQGEGGLIFDKTYGRQRIAAKAKLSKVKFDHFKQLDYDGKDLGATWYWQLGNHLSGRADASYTQVLAPYTDFRSSERNLRQERRGFFDAAWRFHPSWRARGAVGSDKFTYEQASQAVNNRTEDSVEAEFDYLAPSGSTVGLVARRVKGKYPSRRQVGQLVVNDNFTQDELKARVEWLASGSTTVQVLGGWARRRQPSLGEGATSGVNGRVSAFYVPGGKFSLNASVWRDFAPLENPVVSYTLNKGLSVGAAWEATARIRLDGSAAYERRSYNARAVFAGLGDLHDSIRSAKLRATYALRPSVLLGAALVHEARAGSVTLGTGKFSSNSISFNASAQF